MTTTTVKPDSTTSKGGKKLASSKPDTSQEKPFNFVEYFKGVRQEWSKITWPSRPQIIAETGVVIVVVTLFSLFVFFVDKLFQFIIQLIT